HLSSAPLPSAALSLLFLTSSPWPPACSTLLPYTTLFRSPFNQGYKLKVAIQADMKNFKMVTLTANGMREVKIFKGNDNQGNIEQDRKSTRLNSSHVSISYAVFCLNKNNY